MTEFTPGRAGQVLRPCGQRMIAVRNDAGEGAGRAQGTPRYSRKPLALIVMRSLSHQRDFTGPRRRHGVT